MESKSNLCKVKSHLNYFQQNIFSFTEDAGQGHWFSGVLNDKPVQEFLKQQLDINHNSSFSSPPLPNAFSISTMNPATTGSKGGIRILQLRVPFRLATIRVHRLGNSWILNTTNVRRFGFVKDSRQIGIEAWSIDGTDFPTPPLDSGPSYLKQDDTWVVKKFIITI